MLNTDDMKPLSGFRVLNLAVNLPGPAAAARLLLMGADVTKLEPPTGDPMKLYHAGWYRDMAAGQTVIQLDLKDAEGRRTLDELLGGTDLLITATRPAALERLGLNWATLHDRFPRLCQVAIVGYPAPRENEPGHDLTYQASLGLLSPPDMPLTLLADMAGAELAVSRALALLLNRERGWGAGYAEVALSKAAAAMAEPLSHGCTVPGALLGGGVPEYNIYRTTDGWIAVAALEPHFKKRLEEALALGTEEGYRSIFATRSATEWQRWGQERDIPIVKIEV
jgi:crotonobetainyl-CoA:carnitine CoA-transferase CaiB-like acyl-CoA transferase